MMPGQLGWKRLSECGDECFWCGTTFMFKTNDSGPTGLYQYAMAVILPFNEQFIFISGEGQAWANGPYPLPEQSNHNGRPYTLSAEWLRLNLSYIAKIDDPSDVWVARRVLLVPELEGEVH